ncbi:MAG: hypothetical protein ACKO3P_08945, partial [Planctomycetaceae bacterium]
MSGPARFYPLPDKTSRPRERIPPRERSRCQGIIAPVPMKERLRGTPALTAGRHCASTAHRRLP